MADIEKLAQILWDARESLRPCKPLSDQFVGLSIEDAYQISTFNMRRRCSLPKVHQVGKKIGLTAISVQKQLGVEQPDFGYLSSDMLLFHRAHLPASNLIQGKVEGEVAFLLKESLPKSNNTIDDICNATLYVQPCIEVIDSRILDWRIKIQDTIADNASSAYFVLGREKKRLSEVDLVNAKMQLWKNGELASEGEGRACLGNPIFSVRWLANFMSLQGDPLKKGDIILSGAYGPVVSVEKENEFSMEIQGLGKVCLTT